MQDKPQEICDEVAGVCHARSSCFLLLEEKGEHCAATWHVETQQRYCIVSRVLEDHHI